MKSVDPAPSARHAFTRPAIVLCQNVTGLATMRALEQAGVEVHCFLLEAHAFARYSRYGKKILLYGRHRDEPFLLQFLIDYCEKLGNQPVLFPSSDSMALFLAKHAEQLRRCCVFSSTTHDELVGLVSKDGLYRSAAAAGVDTIPCIVTQDAGAIAAWSLNHPAPYLLKPFYEGIDTYRPFEKNVMFTAREDLLGYVAEYGTCSMIVQRMIEGGDGFIFDCYGYCKANGQVLTMASHRRLRQHPPNFGSTCFGEIPANFGAAADRQIFGNTEQLLGKVRYHGIFGIEWLYERASGKFYVIDFNARPFITIGHLQDCGLNLPELAYRELIGQLPATVVRLPVLRHILWMDLLRDINSMHAVEANDWTAIRVWFANLRRCRSFAYQSWRDPGPGIAKLLTIALRFATFLGGKLSGRERRTRFRAESGKKHQPPKPESRESIERIHRENP